MQGVNIDGMSPANQQNIADASNNHFTTIPDMSSKNITDIIQFLLRYKNYVPMSLAAR